MATLSSFLPTLPLIFSNVPSSTMNSKNPQSPLIISAAKSSSFITLHPLKHPKSKTPSFLTLIYNALDDFISDFIDLPLRPSVDPNQVLSGFFAPVDELPPTPCQVLSGSLPPCLDGAYIRIGPNPQFAPRGPYHFLDGDGMLHVIRINGGEPTFCCRYVSTHKHVAEREAGYPFVPSIFASFNGVAAIVSRALLITARVVSGQFDPINQGFGAANTNLALFAGRIFALCESDLPYAVKVTPDGDVVTLGRHDFQASGAFLRMTAHPKIDRVTGEAFAYGYKSTPPFLTFFRISSGGVKQKDVPISSMGGATALHDFAVTENYAVFPDMQLVVEPLAILRGRSPVGVDNDKVPRLGIIRRYAEDDREMVWIEVPGLNPFHFVNAWEEDGGDSIVIVATNAAAVGMFLEEIDRSELTMEEITVDVKAKTVRRRPLSARLLEFGVINPTYAARKNRYVYATVIGRRRTLGLVKLDLSLMEEGSRQDCTVASRLHGPGSCIAEPYFVAREGAVEEDDGYLVAYFYDGDTKESKFLVMDAKSPSLDIVAAVKLPQRVPDGFHGIFVPEIDLNKL